MVSKTANIKSETMAKYKHSNWYCKPKTEAEAKEIIERAVANGAVLYESIGPNPALRQYRWDLCSAWGVFEKLVYTSDLGRGYYLFAGSEELTIEQVRERFPLPSKVDWTNAPHDAQLYSCGSFRRQVHGNEYIYENSDWLRTCYSPLKWHKKQCDFELRPGTEQAETQYTHEYKGHRSVYRKCVIVTTNKDTGGRIIILNEQGFYKTIPQSEVQPIRTKRDKWVDAALSTVSNTDNGHLRYFAELIYDTMTCGDLELPEVGSIIAGWQPIETAPKDRELILSPGGAKESSFMNAVKIGGWVADDEHPNGGCWEVWGGTWAPKYWMSKPDAPNT